MALQNMNLELLRWGSDEAGDIGTKAHEETAFICNRHDHWFTLRNLFGQVCTCGAAGVGMALARSRDPFPHTPPLPSPSSGTT